MKNKPRPDWLQTVLVLFFALLVLGMAWATQYAMTKALQRPHAPGEPVRR